MTPPRSFAESQSTNHPANGLKGAALMSDSATDLTREHYQRPEVREIITKFAMPGGGTWRALNGDFHRWYKNSNDGRARLLNAIEDYEEITSTYRTFYQTMRVFDQNLGWQTGSENG